MEYKSSKFTSAFNESIPNHYNFTEAREKYENCVIKYEEFNKIWKAYSVGYNYTLQSNNDVNDLYRKYISTYIYSKTIAEEIEYLIKVYLYIWKSTDNNICPGYFSGIGLLNEMINGYLIAMPQDYTNLIGHLKIVKLTGELDSVALLNGILTGDISEIQSGINPTRKLKITENKPTKFTKGRINCGEF